MVRSDSSGLKVAERLSPPDSTMIRSRPGKRRLSCSDRFEVDRGVLADRRVRAAAGFHADDPLGRQGLVAHEELGVFLGVDIVGHHSEVVAIAQGLAQGEGQGGFAGTDRPANADAQGLGVHGCSPLGGSVGASGLMRRTCRCRLGQAWDSLGKLVCRLRMQCVSAVAWVLPWGAAKHGTRASSLMT